MTDFKNYSKEGRCFDICNPLSLKKICVLCAGLVEEKNRSHLRYGSLMASNAKYARRVCIKQIPTHFDGSFRTKWNPPLLSVPSHEEKGIGTFLLKKIHILRSVSIIRDSRSCVVLDRKSIHRNVWSWSLTTFFHGILLLWVNTSGRTSVCKPGFYFELFLKKPSKLRHVKILNKNLKSQGKI